MRELSKVPGHDFVIIKHHHGISSSNKAEVFRWQAACSCGWKSNEKVFKCQVEARFNAHKRQFSHNYRGTEHPLREKIIKFAYSGGRPKQFDDLPPKAVSRMFARYGFKLEYLTQEEFKLIMKLRKEKNLA